MVITFLKRDSYKEIQGNMLSMRGLLDVGSVV